jgi:hypothetical protein
VLAGTRFRKSFKGDADNAHSAHAAFMGCVRRSAVQSSAGLVPREKSGCCAGRNGWARESQPRKTSVRSSKEIGMRVLGFQILAGWRSISNGYWVLSCAARVATVFHMDSFGCAKFASIPISLRLSRKCGLFASTTSLQTACFKSILCSCGLQDSGPNRQSCAQKTEQLV